MRASADMAALTGTSAAQSRIRPSSDFYGSTQSSQGQGNADLDQWLADIDQFQTTLEEMAAATLDQDFKDELSAIEQWFRVLSEAERTAALYALLQQTTQVQIRFFIQVLQQMGKNHPTSGVLSPANFDKGNAKHPSFVSSGISSNLAVSFSDPMFNRLSDAMGKLDVGSARNSLVRPSAGTNAKRQSGLDSSTINAMFPDAAAAIATEKAKFTQQTGNPPTSARNSTIDNRSSLTASSLSPPKEEPAQNPASPWGPNDPNRPKSSSSGQPRPPMGQFVQPPPSAGALRSPRGPISGNQNIQSTTLTAAEPSMGDMPILSPYASSGNWASMVNTPMVPTFSQNQGNNAEMVANATAMKLAALSTVSNRVALDDARKYRRARSNDAPGQGPLSPGLPNIPQTVVMINEHGQVVSRDAMLAFQQQQQNNTLGGRSRPSSPGMAMQDFGPTIAFTSPQNNGYLAAYPGQPSLLNNGLAPVTLGQFGLGGPHEGYLSDHSEMTRGRSPRGRRGTSKPPEDPTDPTLLQDIPSWLRSLRLHKYTDNLKDMKWTELIELDDKQLEERGVNALGARRKMLKVFEQVKGKLNSTRKCRLSLISN